MIRRYSLLVLAGVVALVLPPSLSAQVPDAQGTCISGCGGNGGYSAARERQLARNHATHAMHVRWFNEVEGRWKSARHKGVKYTRKGIKEQAKGNCTAALDDFQHELAAFSVDLTTRGPLVDAILSSKYQGMLYSQQEDVRLARGRIAEVGGCAQQQSLAFNRVHVSAAEPTPHAPPRNFQVEPQTNGVNSCYRADPARASCFELRNNSERRVRLYVDGLPGVQCTIEPHSYCSLPMAIGHLHLRMMADDEHGTGPAVEADANVTNEGTRLTLGPRQ